MIIGQRSNQHAVFQSSKEPSNHKDDPTGASLGVFQCVTMIDGSCPNKSTNNAGPHAGNIVVPIFKKTIGEKTPAFREKHDIDFMEADDVETCVSLHDKCLEACTKYVEVPKTGTCDYATRKSRFDDDIVVNTLATCIIGDNDGMGCWCTAPCNSAEHSETAKVSNSFNVNESHTTSNLKYLMDSTTDCDLVLHPGNKDTPPDFVMGKACSATGPKPPENNPVLTPLVVGQKKVKGVAVAVGDQTVLIPPHVFNVAHYSEWMKTSHKDEYIDMCNVDFMLEPCM